MAYSGAGEPSRKTALEDVLGTLLVDLALLLGFPGHYGLLIGRAYWGVSQRSPRRRNLGGGHGFGVAVDAGGGMAAQDARGHPRVISCPQRC